MKLLSGSRPCTLIAWAHGSTSRSRLPSLPKFLCPGLEWSIRPSLSRCRMPACHFPIWSISFWMGVGDDLFRFLPPETAIQSLSTWSHARPKHLYVFVPHGRPKTTLITSAHPSSSEHLRAVLSALPCASLVGSSLCILPPGHVLSPQFSRAWRGGLNTTYGILRPQGPRPTAPKHATPSSRIEQAHPAFD